MTTHVVNLQHNDRFLPDILLLTLCYYHRGIQLNPIKSFDPCSQCPQDVLVCSFVHQLQPMSRRCVFSLHQAATLLPRLWAHYHLSIYPSLPDSRLSTFYRMQVKRYTTRSILLFLKRHLRQRYTTRTTVCVVSRALFALLMPCSHHALLMFLFYFILYRRLT